MTDEIQFSYSDDKLGEYSVNKGRMSYYKMVMIVLKQLPQCAIFVFPVTSISLTRYWESDSGMTLFEDSVITWYVYSVNRFVYHYYFTTKLPFDESSPNVLTD